MKTGAIDLFIFWNDFMKFEIFRYDVVFIHFCVTLFTLFTLIFITREMFPLVLMLLL